MLPALLREPARLSSVFFLARLLLGMSLGVNDTFLRRQIPHAAARRSANSFKLLSNIILLQIAGSFPQVCQSVEGRSFCSLDNHIEGLHCLQLQHDLVQSA